VRQASTDYMFPEKTETNRNYQISKKQPISDRHNADRNL
jgi:glucuronate isomerase